MKKLFCYVGAAALGVATTALATEPLILQPVQADSLAAALETDAVEPAIKLASMDEMTEPMSGCDDCNVGCMCCTTYRPVWGVRAGAAILHRSNPDDIEIFSIFDSFIDISTGSEFNFGYTGGVDIALERRIGCSCDSVEVRYLGALDWNSFVSYDLFGDFDFDFDLDFIDGGELLDARYRSSLDSIEINYRHQYSDRFTWLAGFRYLNLDENLNYAVNLIVPSIADANWATSNNLYGAQIGGDFQLWRLTGPLRVNSVMKAGIYGNDADNDLRLSLLGVPVLEGGASGTQTAFVGEINFNAAYQVTQHIAIRGGYQLLWIDGVALATNQVSETIAQFDADIIDTSSAVFYHGALAGVDVVW